MKRFCYLLFAFVFVSTCGLMFSASGDCEEQQARSAARDLLINVLRKYDVNIEDTDAELNQLATQELADYFEIIRGAVESDSRKASRVVEDAEVAYHVSPLLSAVPFWT